MMEPKKVAIIGAGISGLAACKFILSKGLIPIVLDARGTIGGVWNETLKSTVTQTPKHMFQFSDFPWPKSVTEDFPRCNQVLDYLKSYAEHFGLFEYIRLNTKVLSIDYEGFSDEEIEAWTHWGGSGNAFSERSKWKLNVVDARTNVPLQEVVADFVVVCTGKFGEIPNIPEFPPNEGPKAFKNGKVLHYMQYATMDFDSAMELIKDKEVAIVGFQKSALELVKECTNVNAPNKPCTLLYKTEYWNPPDTRPWGISVDLLFTSRFSELLIHKPGEGFLLYLLVILLSPLRWLLTKAVETHVKRKVNLAKHGMVPKHSLLRDISSCRYAVLPDKFYDKVNKGSIILKKAPSFSFCKEGIMIKGETKPIRSDLVILATGYRGDLKLKNIFTSSTFRDYMSFGDSAIPLYRQCIHPRIPQLAMVGFTESASNLFTTELRCRWLAEFLGGTFKLPSIKEMEKDIGDWDKCLKLYSGPSYKRGCIGMLHHCYSDQVCKDMGWNPRRRKGFFANWFIPHGPLDYASP
ncbi:probable flavin-containing monooxygenase 1 [Benincasa hispida]|uniref:probable flavin-containing monooxygenase 1 n=1 Tax=Benincasa hispida TaxID=102211 RepID=UPI001900B109|nr:probable flavin-containing monooxygenase 1 [Benincasa hispida]